MEWIKEFEEKFVDVLYPTGTPAVQTEASELVTFITTQITKARERRDKEVLIMMDEAERKGMTFDRFITAFGTLIHMTDEEKAALKTTI